MHHIDDHDLERYHLGMVTDETELAQFEEHMLCFTLTAMGGVSGHEGMKNDAGQIRIDEIHPPLRHDHRDGGPDTDSVVALAGSAHDRHGFTHLDSSRSEASEVEAAVLAVR